MEAGVDAAADDGLVGALRELVPHGADEVGVGAGVGVDGEVLGAGGAVLCEEEAVLVDVGPSCAADAGDGFFELGVGGLV